MLAISGKFFSGYIENLHFGLKMNCLSLKGRYVVSVEKAWGLIVFACVNQESDVAAKKAEATRGLAGRENSQ